VRQRSRMTPEDYLACSSGVGDRTLSMNRCSDAPNSRKFLRASFSETTFAPPS
jgi:hypothetical protein